MSASFSVKCVDTNKVPISPNVVKRRLRNLAPLDKNHLLQFDKKFPSTTKANKTPIGLP